MDAHEPEYLAAVAGMTDTYGTIVPTPPVIATTGSRRIPVWNVGATVCWTDSSRRHRTGTVIDVVFAGESRNAEDRIYRIQTRDPVSLQRRHVELTHHALCEF